MLPSQRLACPLLFSFICNFTLSTPLSPSTFKHIQVSYAKSACFSHPLGPAYSSSYHPSFLWKTSQTSPNTSQLPVMCFLLPSQVNKLWSPGPLMTFPVDSVHVGTLKGVIFFPLWSFLLSTTPISRDTFLFSFLYPDPKIGVNETLSRALSVPLTDPDALDAFVCRQCSRPLFGAAVQASNCCQMVRASK